MAGNQARELRGRINEAWENLSRQLDGMDAHLERADGPGEWTAREVLSHMLFEPGFDPVKTLSAFAESDYPVVVIAPGDTYVDDPRRQMTLPQLRDALDTQRRRVLDYIEGLSDRDLDHRKARIPFFKQFMGTDEITIEMYVGAMFDYHWNDHAGQLAKIRDAVGLTAGPVVKPSGAPI